MIPLPIDAHVPRIVGLADRHRAVVVTAAPGAGKTTRVPPALASDGPVPLLQPRRVAARAIARRIAAERGWTVGREVGWHVRFDRQFSADTKLLVATEGILTARLQQDPLVAGFRTVVIDEFHERSIHADLGLALAREAWLARDDLRLVVMSATLDAARVAAYLHDCPVVEVAGRTWPLEIAHRPGVAPEAAIADVLPRAGGAVLCFLPGAPEIRRAADRLAGVRGLDEADRRAIFPLHGGLDADEQDAALRPTGGRRVVLATNLAETTLTVPDVTCVVDTGLHKVARYDPDRAIDSLDTERISQDSADQRAGRAGRTQAGVVVRLWDSRDRLRPHREPEIARVDLASTALDVLSWGGDPRALAWFEAPPAGALSSAMDLLRRLGAIDARDALTPLGRQLRRLPLHPRLGRILIEGRAAPLVARACALLSERHLVAPRHGTTPCDLLSATDREQDLPPHVLRIAREIREVARRELGGAVDRLDEREFRRAVLAGYPDRVARRRAPRSDRFLLAAGAGARLARESGVVDAEFIVAVDVASTTRPGGAGVGGFVRAPGGSADSGGDEAIIRLATSIERDWLEPTSIEVTHSFDADAGLVRAARVQRYDAIALSEHPVPPDPVEAGGLVAEAYLRRGPSEDDAQLLRRLRFAGIEATFENLVREASAGQKRLADVDIASAVPYADRRRLAELAPESIKVPNGRDVRLEYREDGAVVASVRLQAVFGLRESPRVGARRVPVTFELLAPSGRPVQVTSDLASFWARGYAEVRKELHGRYPKHRWPIDPSGE